MKKTILLLAGLLLSLSLFSQLYNVRYIKMYDETQEIEMNPTDYYVMIGTSYIYLSAKKNISSNLLYKYKDLVLEEVTTIDKAFNPSTYELGFKEFYLYSATNEHGLTRHVYISTNEDEESLKYLVLELYNKVFIHLIIQRP